MGKSGRLSRRLRAISSQRSGTVAASLAPPRVAEEFGGALRRPDRHAATRHSSGPRCVVYVGTPSMHHPDRCSRAGGQARPGGEAVQEKRTRRRNGRGARERGCHEEAVARLVPHRRVGAARRGAWARSSPHAITARGSRGPRFRLSRRSSAAPRCSDLGIYPCRSPRWCSANRTAWWRSPTPPYGRRRADPRMFGHTGGAHAV